MATLHGLAGQRGKSEAKTRGMRMFMTLCSIGSVGIAIFGFAAGFFWREYGPWLASGVMLVVGGIHLYVLRRADKYLDSVARERLKFLRGAQGEAVIAWLLKDLENEWHVFNNIQLESASDIDHIVVGPGGLYCISTKSQRGLFTGTPQGLLHNGQPSNFANQAMGQAMELKKRLAAMMGNNVPWITPILALPFGYTEGNACGGKVWLVHQWDIINRISPEKPSKPLSKGQISRMVEVLEMIQSSAAGVYQRPAVVEYSAKPV